jgi:hypothetical protein
MDQRSSLDTIGHPAHPPALAPSLLRLSVPARLLIAAGLALFLCAAALWALF